MKYKTSELTGALLDAAVAKAEGWTKDEHETNAWWAPDGHACGPCASISEAGILHGYGYHPAHDWAHAGTIIERERISLFERNGEWIAGFHPECCQVSLGEPDAQEIRFAHERGGPSPLIAAMRAYVASKFGDEVEL